MPAGSILVVDDDPVQRRLAEAALKRGGHAVLLAENGAQALALTEAQAPLLVVLDLVMPGGPDGLAVLEALRRQGLRVPVIVQTAQGGIETVVQAMRAGAFDFVVKPVSPEKLLLAVSRALKVEAVEEAARRQAARGKAPVLKSFAAGSAAMQRPMQLARKAAASGIPVLIEGESGTGKEVLARAIRASGERRGKPFVTVNCGAIPESLVESILFGHEKGAFTGAGEKHPGKFVEADGGTLFLDEVGDLPANAQVKLLRAVQEGEVDPVGGRGSVRVDIRLISATHRDLLQEVREGRFREDLFYRLHVFPIRLPALRERREEIPDLVRLFIARAGAAQRIGRVSGIGRGALALLQAYDWPGNVRQLENAVLRACALADGDTLTEAEFPQIEAQVAPNALLRAALAPPPRPSQPGPAAPLRQDEPQDGPLQPGGSLSALDGKGEVRPLAAVEEEMIRLAVAHYGGQMSEVARRLGIGRSTLYRKLREFGIEASDAREPESGLGEAAE